jgi:uncharacterized membrane protein YesL
VPEAPRLGRVVRAALSDFYFNSGRLVPANLVWGASAVVLWLVWLVWPLAALGLSPLLAFPTVAVFRVAGRIVRESGDGSFRAVLAACRDDAGPTLLLGLAFVASTLILGTNLAVGLTQSEPLGWVIGTFAAWGLVVLWCAAIVTWPLVVDPERASQRIGQRLRLAGLLLLAFPVRFVLLGALVAIVTLVSAVLLAVLLTVSIAFIALIACRYMYPAADRLELRLARGR